MDLSLYPDNYDFLSEEEKNDILDYMNDDTIPVEDKHAYAQELENDGIMVGFDWAGDRGKWILVDYWRAEKEEDWRWQSRY